MGFVALVLIGILVSQASCSSETLVDLIVNYETLCPDSIAFFKNQLKPLMDSDIGKYVNLSLIPWGKSTYTRKGSSYSFTCQHGQEECAGNKFQACALKFWKRDPALDLIFCTMTLGNRVERTPQQLAHKCKKLLKGLPVEDIEKCARTFRGNQYFAHFGGISAKLSPKPYFIPWLIFNGKWEQKKMFDGIKDLRKVVCDHIGHEKCRGSGSRVFGK